VPIPTSNRLCLIAAAVAGALGLSVPALAQSITPDQARRAVQETSALIRKHYVDKPRREATARMLEKNLAGKRYALTDARDLSSVVTEDLRAFTKDGHMSLSWDPTQHALAKSRADAPAPDPQLMLAEALPMNHGLTEMRILPGNVRYLRINAFQWIPDVTGAAYDSAMRFLRDGSAAIVDLRGNGGGSTSAVRYAISHFMPADSGALMITFNDMEGNPDQTRALDYLPSGRVTAPLFVLTDNESVSAAEEFVYHVRHFNLGTLVGSRTKGAANNNLLYPVEGGFVASISVDRPVHAVTNGNWEGVGIEPHIRAARGTELRAAHVAALEKVAASATGAAKARASWALVRARAELNPPAISPAQLQSYAGNYQGRVLRVEGGTMIYERPGAPPSRPIYLGNDMFGFPETGHIRLRISADRQTLEAMYDDGSTVAFRRSQ
jgi:hypothetical protein